MYDDARTGIEKFPVNYDKTYKDPYSNYSYTADH
jgi:hypothetical protein